MTNWAELDALHAAASAAPPAGSFTVYEYCERYGMNRCTAGNQLSRLTHSGRLESGLFRTSDGKQFRWQRYYWGAECRGGKSAGRKMKSMSRSSGKYA